MAARHVLGVTSLWLLLPVYVGAVRTSLLTAECSGWLLLAVLLCATASSVAYWGYCHDDGILLKLDVAAARCTAGLHLVYALTLSPVYALVGIVGTLGVAALYTASHEASIRQSPWSVKVTYHLLFRYVGFWEVFVLHGRTVFHHNAWGAVVIITTVVYFTHAFVTFVHFSPAVTYESRLFNMSLIIVCTGILVVPP